MKQQSAAAPSAFGVAPLKTVGHADAAHRRRRAGHGQGELHQRRPAAGHALRARCCAARIRTPGSSRSTCRRRGRCPASRRSSPTRTARWCGAPARSPAASSTTTRSRRSPSSAATPSTTRCGSSASRSRRWRRSIVTSPKRRSPLIAVDYEVLPFVLDQEEALKPGAPQIWPEGNLVARTTATRRSRSASAAATSTAAFARRGARVRGSLLHRVRAQRADGAARLRRALGRRQADRLHADRRHRQLPPRHGARSRHARREGPRRLPVHGRQLRQQEPEPGRRSDHRGAGQGSRRRRSSSSCRARKTSSASTAAGRPSSTTRSASTHDGTLTGDPAARLQRHGPVPQELRRDRPASSSTSARTSRARSRRSTPTGPCRGTSAARSIPQGFFGIQSMMDDVAYRAEDRSGRLRILKNMTRHVARRGAVHQLHARGVRPRAAPRRSTGKRAGGRSRARTPGRSSAAPAWRSWRSARGSAGAARCCGSTRRAATRCSSASPTSAPAPRRRWG